MSKSRKKAAPVVPSQVDPAPPRDEKSFVHLNDFDAWRIQIEKRLEAVERRTSL